MDRGLNGPLCTTAAQTQVQMNLWPRCPPVELLRKGEWELSGDVDVAIDACAGKWVAEFTEMSYASRLLYEMMYRNRHLPS